MTCRIKEASFNIFAYGVEAYNPINGNHSYNDVHDCNQIITVSADRVKELYSDCNRQWKKPYNNEIKDHLELWHIPLVLLIDMFHFNSTYISSYVATSFDANNTQILIKYGHMPVWLLKRIL